MACTTLHDILLLRRGSAFLVAGSMEAEINGVISANFTGHTGASQLRDQEGVLIADLVFTWLDAAEGLYELSFAGPTTDWPLTTASFDLLVTTPDGYVIPSQEKYWVDIYDGVTQP